MLTRVPASELAGRRWDPGYWDPALARPLDGLDPGWPIVDLGDDLGLIAYGPIVTGRAPEPRAVGTLVITGTAFTGAGLDPSRAVRVAPGSAWDPPRTRLRPRDLLLPRSGAGSLGRGRMGVWDSHEPANVGCFVDVLRLSALDPWYVWAFLRTRFGWGQIARLVNGVAQPNISFDEVRGLRIAAPPPEDQAAVAAAYSRDVAPVHEVYLAADFAGRREGLVAARAAHSAWVARVESWLAGDGPAL